jgi:hypothetical protein
MKHALIVVIVAASAVGCAAQVKQTEQMLSAAGFEMKPADSPERQAALATLPPRKLVVEQRDGRPYFVYADPKHCHCLFVGDERAYQAYQRLKLEKEIADERLLAAERALDWELWGPWPHRWWRY